MMGPARPPSCWPLDYVPAPILNSIVDHLGWEALAASNALYLYNPGDSPNDHRPFTLDLQNFSLVDWTFRHNVMGRKIIHTLVLHGVDDMRGKDGIFSPQLRRHFR